MAQMNTFAVGQANRSHSPKPGAQQKGSRPVSNNTQFLYPITPVTLQRKAACACGGGCPRCRKEPAVIQTKLNVSTPGDVYEQEADRAAEQVMRMTNPSAEKVKIASFSSLAHLQRKPSACESKRKNCKPLEEEREMLQPKELEGHAPASSISERTQAQLAGARGGGHSLPETSLAFFQQRFGHDFSQVRVHTDASAAETSRAINARAYTIGSDIFFGAGQFAPGTQAGDHLIAHELAHTIQQSGSLARSVPTIQRKIGDGFDLTSPIMAGDEVLEACFDGERKLKFNDTGTAVEKLQKTLMALGFELPKFGADKTFGDETRKAVKKFQQDAGMTGGDVDGVVGAKTIGLLDMASRHGKVEKDEDQKSEDFKIKDKFIPAKDKKDEPHMIFFRLADTAIDKDELKKIDAIKNDILISKVTLVGFASEEGSAAFNRDLAKRRAEAVAEKLKGTALTIEVAPPDAEAGLGDIKYRHRRAVKILIGNEKHVPEPNCKGRSTVEACPKPHKLLEDAVTDSLEMINRALNKLPPATPDDTQIFDDLFRTDDTNRDTTVPKVLDIINKMSKHIEDIPKAGNFKCASECDPICKAGSPAYNQDRVIKGKTNTPGITFTCPTFKDETRKQRGIIIMHEGHHGTEGIPSGDFAYRDMRLMKIIDTDTALKNASSFELLIKLLDDPKSGVIGPKEPDVFSVQLKSKDERDALVRTVAWIQMWVKKADFGTSELYAGVREAREKKSWAGNDEAGTMSFVAPRFGLTAPPAAPLESDKNAVAAIHDRIILMVRVLKEPVSFDKTTTGQDTWERGPKPKVKVTQAFFNLAPSRQVIALLQELVHATPDISARLEPEYVNLIDFFRVSTGVAGPTP